MYNYMWKGIKSSEVRTEREEWIIHEACLGRQYSLASFLVFLSKLIDNEYKVSDTVVHTQ